MYCSTDVLNYDNYDWIDPVVAEQTYYCVAFNVLKEEPLVCNPELNLIANGDFENPEVTDGAKWQTFTSGIDWSVDWVNLTEAIPSLELHRGVNGWLPSAGAQYAELDGDTEGPGGAQNGESASVMISQNIPTIPGKNYKLTFDFSPRPNKDASENVLGVSWGGVAESPISAAGGSQTNWTPHTFNFTATTSLTTVMFKDLGTSNSEGTFLDNVSLVCQDKQEDPCQYFNQVIYSGTDDQVDQHSAVATWTHNAWVATSSPAVWIWSDANVLYPTQDELKVFTKNFVLSGNPTGDALLSIASDNTYKVTINGNIIASTTNESNYSSFTNYVVPASALVNGSNSIEIVVHNWALGGGTSETNPAGVIYALYTNSKQCPGDEPDDPGTSLVHVTKFLDGKQADGESANDESFNIEVMGSWSGNFYLNSNNSYESNIGQMGENEGYEFTNEDNHINLFEDTEESNVVPFGGQCSNGKFKVVGYTYGETLTEALNSSATTTDKAELHDIKNDTYIVVWNETCPDLATVNICKVDQNDNSLSGWTMMLKGELMQNDLSVPTNTSAGVNSVPLVLGESYIAEATGTWLNQGGANPVDTEYSTTDTWATQMDGYTGYQTDILELQINSIFDPNSDWGAYNSAHRYAQSFVSAVNGPANFRIFDGTGTSQNEGWFGDNSGTLNVDIYEGYAGITGENGCVTFTDVPFGQYSVDEVAQDGWTNVSGLGSVVVDEPNETFEVKNSDGTVPPVQCTEGYVKVENECVLDEGGDDEDDGGEDGPTSETPPPAFTPSGRRHDVSGLFGGGSVLGASTEDLICEPYLNEYIRYGANNNPEEVKKLQIFLNQFFELDNPVTGVYGPITFEMVKKFQAHQKDAILLPWTIFGMPTEDPTGYVYKTTKRWINILKCPEMITTSPFPSLP